MALFHGAFIIGQLLKDNSIVDPLWGLGFVVVAWYSFMKTDVISVNHLIVTLLVTVWGVRLAWHIIRRNRGRGEDWRYAEWRKQWGKSALFRAYLQVYLLQALLMWVIVQPVIYVNSHDVSTLGYYFLLSGVLVWIFGFFFESVGDRELRDFVAKPKNKGKVMTTGLWQYTRHPNYFGEATMWWGIWIINLGSMPWAIWLLASPLTINGLLLYVSGVPLLEKKMSNNPEFREYAKHTSKFIPRRPR